MRDEIQEQTKARRAALFILAAMTLALVYMVVQLDWWSSDSAPPPAVVRNTIAAYRIIVQPPAGDWLNTGNPAVAASRFKSAGALWVMLRVPLWTPTSRRAEYSIVEHAQLSGTISALRDAGARVILAPVYWNGSVLSPRPAPAMSKEFFLTYSGMATSMADFAEESGAEALLLDGVFGDPSISAAEWVTLISEIRSKYSGALEGRIGEGLTPRMYLTHLDGGYVAQAGTGSAASQQDETGTPLYLLMDDADEYTTGAFPWQPRLRKAVREDGTFQAMLATTDEVQSLRGLVLTGAGIAMELMSNDDSSDHIAALRSLRQRRLVQDLGRTEGETVR